METLTEEILTTVIKKRPAISHKGSFGRTVLIGGNTQYGGAIIMSAESCLKSGAGLVTVITAKENHAPLHARLPEVMVLDWHDQAAITASICNADVVLIGPGLGLTNHSLILLKLVLDLQEKQWLVIDGSAISLFAQEKLTLSHPHKTVFTPHQMEWQRLSGIPIVEQNELANRAFQKKLAASIVVKSHRTEIYTNKNIYRCPLGNSAMATGGTGDTLAGMIAGFLAQFPRKDATICAAVYLHSYIGDLLATENYVVLPTTISAALPHYMCYFSN
ncbi:ADP-dependent (S)-NAD(P)H-hydrate dehydratase [Enterococcus saigonensis]|uniref:ADP-dependent (S)-NAD(P)H-hydrate dehydratase n=1 Tax=Enterococcus saigonensis TaxID=1805431 RepID=A0A679IA09_9ENTE|nr:NAD(P)H-hydrate dehydratase [Enterococcus saigonensis]BCA86488.1 ADP-dependent (S)-NAD(P)H-hydrate dehydratase [Enterococcus saigonensis]